MSGCAGLPESATRPASDANESPDAVAAKIAPSPHRVVGQVLATDSAGGLAWVDLGHNPMSAPLTEGTELLTRSLDLRPTGRLRVSRYLQGRTLGTLIVGGQPTTGDEVVWIAP